MCVCFLAFPGDQYHAEQRPDGSETLIPGSMSKQEAKIFIGGLSWETTGWWTSTRILPVVVYLWVLFV